MAKTITDKQQLVRATISYLTRKKGASPTLEELRAALNYPKISSVQTHTEVLKEKGYLDQSVRGLSPHPNRNPNSIFTLKNEQLGLLAPDAAVVFFRSLMLAEARRLGIPVNKITISLWTNVPDGGIDAAISDLTESEAGALQSSGLIKTGTSGYQVKTGGSFKPWLGSEIKNELFGRKHPSKENLGSSIKTCLDHNGRYILVCFGQEFTVKQLKQANDALIYYFKQCGYQNPRVEVWGQSVIIGFAQVFPSLILQLQGFDRSQFQTHKSWGQQDDMQREFKTGAAQEEFIKNLQTELRRREQAIHARVWGEPGAGKTRLVLEATRTEDLSPLIIYCDSPDKFRDSNLMNEIIKEDNHFSALIIIDECNSDSRSYIWNKLKGLGPRIKLVTIYNEYDDSSGTTTYFATPLLGNAQTSEIIQGYHIPKDQADRWSELCSGSPRVAHVIGWNLKNNPEDLLKPLDSVNIWDRYITSGDNPQSTQITQRKLVLQFIALFKMFGFGRLIIDESKAIAKMVETVDHQITFPRFQEIVRTLKERKILQGENTLYITPKALHIQLWKEWWETYGSAFDFNEFSKNIPDSLRGWFYEMFKYAAESEAASTIVEELLGGNGLFQKSDYLKTKLGSDFFLTLTEANPEAALKCLQSKIEPLGKEELHQLKEPRRNFVWALERIAVWKKLFTGAAHLLLALGEAENETYGNNASGIFIGLFSPGPRGVAPTEASPEERFPILREALSSDSKERRMLALNACDKALEANYFHRMVGPEYQGLKTARLWSPKNRAEMISAYHRVWDLLYSKLDTLPEEEQKKAVTILLNNARSLSSAPELVDTIISNITDLSKKSYVNKQDVLEELETILYYGKKELSSDTINRWKTLRDNLVGTDFSSLMKRYVAMDILEDKFDDNGQRVDKAEESIKELAQRSISNPELLKVELSWLPTTEAKNGYRFANELGQQDKKFSLLPILLDAQRSISTNKDASDYFLGGYLKALFDREPKRWEVAMDELGKDDKLTSWVAGLTWRSGMSDQAALRVLNLAQKDVLKPYNFRVFGLGSVINGLSEKIFKQWIEYLLNCPEDYAASIALDLYHLFYIRKDSKFTIPKDLTLRLLSHKSLYTPLSQGIRNQMDDFHWTEIGKKFVELFPKESLSLANTILEHFGEDGTILEGYHKDTFEVINLISRKYPGEVWKRVAKYLGPPIDSRAFHIQHWLRGEGFFEETEGTLSSFTPDMVWQWVDQDIETRAEYLASFVPKILFKQDNKICWAREVLVKYGRREDVQKSLLANFSSEGWTGPASAHYAQKRDGLLAFKEKENNEDVKNWIDRFVVGLEKQIEYEKINEERRGF